MTLISENADDIETITNGKVNVSDIIDNLTTNVSNKPLSAAQGVALKELIDNLNAALGTKASTDNLNTLEEKVDDHWENTYQYNLDRSANTILAAPNGSNGFASFRRLTEADLPNYYLPLSGGAITGKIDLTAAPNANDGQKMGLTSGANGGIHLRKNGANDEGNAITWSYAQNDEAHAGIYVKSSGSYGTKMYLATTNLFNDGAKAALEIDHVGNIKALRSNFIGNLTGEITANTSGQTTTFNNVSTSGISYVYYKANGAIKTSSGYYNGLSYIGSEASTSGYARIGINDNGIPQYWSGLTASTANDLIHTGNIGSQSVNYAASANYANSAGYAATAACDEDGNNFTTSYQKVYGNRNVITVGGDANTYYPILIQGLGQASFAWSHLHISRGYSETAPDSWNTSTHKGGLTLSIRWSGDSGWGGNDKRIAVEEFHEMYSSMVGGLTLSVNGLIVWLRGGTATYTFQADYGNSLAIIVYLGTFTASDNRTYAAKSSPDTASVYGCWYDRGGTYSGNATGLKLDSSNYGTSLPSPGTAGRVFFVKV